MNVYIDIDCDFLDGKKEAMRRLSNISYNDRDKVEQNIEEMLDYIFGKRDDSTN